MRGTAQMELPQLKKEFLTITELAERWSRLRGEQVTEEMVLSHGEDGSLVFMITGGDRRASGSVIHDESLGHHLDFDSWRSAHLDRYRQIGKTFEKHRDIESLASLMKKMPILNHAPSVSPYNAFEIKAAQLRKLLNSSHGVLIGDLMGEQILLEQFSGRYSVVEYPLFFARERFVNKRLLIISMEEVEYFELSQANLEKRLSLESQIALRSQELEKELKRQELEIAKLKITQQLQEASNRIRKDLEEPPKSKPRLPDYISPENAKKQNKTTTSNKQKLSKQEKREQELERLIADKGLDCLEPLGRIGVWQKLTKIEPKLFPYRTAPKDSTVKKFFDNQPLISFERGR